MIPYILHVTVITTICFLFYKLLLQKETFYHLNRWILTGCLAVSFGLPLLPIPRDFSWRDKWTEARPETQTTAAGTNADTRPFLLAADGRSPSEHASPTDAQTAAPVAMVQQKEKTSATRKSDLKRARHTPEHERKVHLLNTASAGQAGDSKTLLSTVAGSKQPDGPKTVGAGSMRPGVTKGVDASAQKAQNAQKAAATGIAANLLLVVKWLFYGYLFGLLIFGGSFFLQIAVLLYQSYSRPVIRDGRFRIVEIRGDQAPCSFGNTIFINPEKYDWDTYNQILIHEKIHVNGRHTLDILLAEIAVVLQWFNPFVWWYRREVENNLEFLTDASVLLHREVERSAYQLSLLRVSAPNLPFSITNNYNQSLLKRRIVMMNSKRSSLHTVWKYFFLLPVFSVLMCALNKPAALAAAVKPMISDPSGASHTAETTIAGKAGHALSDTTVRPASGNMRAHQGSQGSDSSAEHRYYNENDYETLKAYSDAQGLYIQDQVNYNLAQVQQAMVQVHLNDKQLHLSGQQLLLQQQLMGADAHLNVAGQALNNINLNPAMNLKLDIRPNIDPTITLSHMSMMADTGIREGAWFATSSDDKLRIELRSGDDEHNWNSTFSVDKKEINPFPGQGNVEFKLVREAGTITFKGQFDGQEGFGHFQFAPTAGYMDALKQLGVEDMDDRREFAFFSLDIKKEYVDMLVHNGYPHISQRDLISFAAMKIDKDFIQEWKGSGFDDADNPRTLISLKALKIDRAYVNEMKDAGYDHLNVHDLMSLRAMHVDRAYIRSLGRNSDNTPIPIREVISYKAMHIDSGYVEGLRKAGFTDLSRRDVTSLYAMHVTPEYIQSLKDLGYADLSTRELTSLKAMSITPEIIKGYREMGFKDLDARELTSLKAMNITPEFVKGFRDIGYTDLGARELSSLKAMNVTPEFVKEFNKIGFEHIPVHTLTSLKAMGIDADYVAKMKAKGFVSDDLNKYIRLKNAFN